MKITDFLKSETHAPICRDYGGLGHLNGNCSYDPVHGGVDIFAPKGTPIQSIADGEVIWAADESYVGNAVVLLHENNVVSKYLHLDRMLVEPQEKVRGGQLLGFVGNTGKVCTKNPSGNGGGRCLPHLHFEVGIGLNEPYHTSRRFMRLNPLPILPDMLEKFQERHSFPLALDAPARRGWYVRVPLSYVPLFLRLAVISVEDRRFLRHHGVDFKALVRALVQNLKHRRITQGGSTITQQAARSAFLATECGWKRKAVEAIVAIILEVFYSKNAILELYLNTIYLGRGSIGVQSAASNFLQKHLLDLNFKECLFLTTLISSPLGNEITPEMWEDREKRMGLVLRAMQDQGMIDSYIVGITQSQPLIVGNPK